MKEPKIGDFAVCTDGHQGFVTAVRDSPYGRMILIVVPDGKVYHFPLDMLENKNGRQPMTKGRAAAIVRNIHEDNSDPEDKLLAIQEVVDMETHNGITKQVLLDTLRWLIEDYIN